MKKPTPTQVKAEIAAMREMQPYVRKISGFGENHQAAISAQIEVLEKNMCESVIYDRYEPQPLDADDDPETMSRHELDNALEVRRWLDGEERETPSKGWAPLDSRLGLAKRVSSV